VAPAALVRQPRLGARHAAGGRDGLVAVEVQVSRDTAGMRPTDWLRLVRLAARRRSLIAGSALLLLGVATAVAIVRPNTYEAATEIIVRPQRLPADFIKSTVNQDLGTVVKSLQQQIMSRSRLQKIIEEYGLYPEVRQKRGTLAAIEHMRQSIRVESWSADSFKILFRGEDPVQVRDVTNTLAALFIQENLRLREQEAATITDYLEQELERAQRQLEQSEAEIRQFQERNMGALPSQEQAIANTLSSLMGQYQTLSDGLRSAQNRKLVLSGQLRDQARQQVEQSSPDAVLPTAVELARSRRQLERLQRQLTDDHPQVRTLRETVLALEAKVALERASGARPEQGAPGSGALQAELQTADREIAALLAERSQLQRRMEEQERLLSKIPRVSEEFSSLRRKYEFAQSTYNDLRGKAEEARRSQQMEERQKGEQFEIVDKAIVPPQPTHPRKSEIVLGGLLFGLGLGFALAFLLAFLDPTFRVKEELLAAVPLPLLTAVPKIEGGPGA